MFKPSRLPRKNKKHIALLAIAAAAALALSPQSHACGPFFPNQLLMEGDNALLNMPTADFAFELHRLHAKSTLSLKYILPAKNQDVYQQSAAIDTAELLEALDRSGVSAPTRDRIVRDYRSMRDAI